MIKYEKVFWNGHHLYDGIGFSKLQCGWRWFDGRYNNTCQHRYNKVKLLSYSQTTGAEVNETSNINGENNEKLVCKVLSGGQLQLTHKNVIFDEGTNIKFDSQLVGNKIIITETGDYGKSGKYGYFTLVAKVGIVKDGDYVIVVKRNDHTREEFNMHYDSSKAK